MINSVNEPRTRIQVLRNPCFDHCVSWISEMEREGFEIEVQNASWHHLMLYREMYGVPDYLGSCHSALVEGYIVEGHVSAAHIRRLLSERPNAIGISAPAFSMRCIEARNETDLEKRQVYLISRDGSAEEFFQLETA